MRDWEELADWYDKKQGDTGDLWHRALIDPVLLKLLGDCRGEDVLDLGCGNGYLARRLARSGARVTAVDSSPGMIRKAKAHDSDDSLKIRYVSSDANTLEGIAGAGFDLVFANMSLMDVEDAEAAIGQVSRVLRSGGRFVASISHPCFDNGSNSGWVAEKSTLEQPLVSRRIRAYRDTFSEEIPWKTTGKEIMYTRSFHRPLNWYARVIRSNGLAITSLEEPEPTEELLEAEDPVVSAGFLEVPLHLVIEAIKLRSD